MSNLLGWLDCSEIPLLSKFTIGYKIRSVSDLNANIDSQGRQDIGRSGYYQFLQSASNITFYPVSLSRQLDFKYRYKS
jgi:hypothetical protein